MSLANLHHSFYHNSICHYVYEILVIKLYRTFNLFFMWFTEAGKFLIGMYYIFCNLYLLLKYKYMLRILYIYLDQQLYYTAESLNILTAHDVCIQREKHSAHTSVVVEEPIVLPLCSALNIIVLALWSYNVMYVAYTYFGF